MAEPKPKPEADFFSSFLSFLTEIITSIPVAVWLIILGIAAIIGAWTIGYGPIIMYTIFALVLGKIAGNLWMHYIRRDFISGIDWVLLEIVPPREVLRSPKAMELFFTNALYHYSNKAGREWYWQGAVWFWFSLEIASIDGQVHFYIRTPTRLKEFIETQMYAQYPQAQVKEVDDYTLAVPEISEKSGWKFWGCEWSLAKPDAYPIKTYVDFGLDKDPKEEFKVDPISPVIELFGSLKKGEQMWLQIIITPSKKEYKSPEGAKQDWVNEAETELFRVTEPYTARKEKMEQGLLLIRIPDWIKPIIEGISRKMQKTGFDVGMRTCYVAKDEAWDMNNRRNIRMIWRQYANPYLNSFERINSTQADSLGGGGFLGSFFLLSPQTVMILCDRMLKKYRNRSFFHGSLRQKILAKLPWPFSPWIYPAYFKSKIFVLNVEELATIWHFPGQILSVPTLERIESKEASPPTNLPT